MTTGTAVTCIATRGITTGTTGTTATSRQSSGHAGGTTCTAGTTIAAITKASAYTI